MTIYRVMVGMNEFHVEFAGSQLLINGEPVNMKLIPINQLGSFLLRRGENKREIHLQALGRNVYSALTSGRHVLAQVERSNGKNKRASTVNAGDVHAPMPGLVVNVLAVEGQQVASGEVLVVLESMKMQMEFRAPFAGRVDKVAVKNNQQVEKGALLVRVLES